MIPQGSSSSAATATATAQATATEPNITTAGAPEGDFGMEIFKGGLALMSMRHAGNRAEWHKALKDAEKYDPFMFQALQRDPTQQYVFSQGGRSEPREHRERSPVSDSETQSEGSSASTILLVENEHDLDGRVERDTADGLEEQDEDVDEEMTEDEAAENPSADGHGDAPEDEKISNSGQEDVEMAESDPPARSTKKRPRKKTLKARARKGKGKVNSQRVLHERPEKRRPVAGEERLDWVCDQRGLPPSDSQSMPFQRFEPYHGLPWRHSMLFREDLPRVGSRVPGSPPRSWCWSVSNLGTR